MTPSGAPCASNSVARVLVESMVSHSSLAQPDARPKHFVFKCCCSASRLSLSAMSSTTLSARNVSHNFLWAGQKLVNLALIGCHLERVNLVLRQIALHINLAADAR